MSQPSSYTSGPVALTLYRMAWPMVWGLLATMSFNAIDTLFVSRLGPEYLAAMSFTFPVAMVMNSVGIGLGAGVSSVLSRQLGSGDAESARRFLGVALVFGLVLSSLLTLLGIVCIEPLFRQLGAEPGLIVLIREYMQIWYLNVPLLVVGMLAQSALRARGNSKVAGTLMLVSALCNGLLDPLLIFGLAGFPRLEMAGAAWATILSRLLLVAAALWYVQGRFAMFGRLPATLQLWRKDLQALLHVGLPAMVTNIIIPLASGVVVALVARHGASAVAGLGVAMRIEPVVLIVFYALSSVAGPFFGQNLGAGQHRRLHKGLRVIGLFCLLWGGLLALLLGGLGGYVAGWFSTDPEVVAVATAYLSIVPVSYGLYGVVMSVNAGFNGMGRPLPSLVVSAARVFVIYLPLAWLGQWLWAINGLFVATALANVLVGVGGFWWLRQVLFAQARAQTLSR